MSNETIKKSELKSKLSPVQYRVTQESGTEAPFDNEYWDKKEHGIYVDVVDGTPLFSSLDKFDSGTGWPSFSKSISKENVSEVSDRSLGVKRVEVRSTKSNSHLGHVFEDGPKPSGRRYCMNSAALRFVPFAELDREGLGSLKALFQEVLEIQN